MSLTSALKRIPPIPQHLDKAVLFRRQLTRQGIVLARQQTQVPEVFGRNEAAA
jgi:hypothetical protein